MHWLLLSLCGLDALCLAGLLGVPQLGSTIGISVWLVGHTLIVLLGALYLGNRTKPSVRLYGLWLVVLIFLPVIGLLLGWIFLRKSAWYKPPIIKESSPEGEPCYLDLSDRTVGPYDAEQASQRMSALTTDDYLDLLAATRQLDGKQSVALLKDALGSQTEGARLLAHALYTKKEQQLMQQLSSLIERFKQGQGRNPQLHLAFAQLYWHWFDLGVLDAEGRTEILTKIRLHAAFVLTLIPNLAQAHWLIAQTYLHTQRYQDAEKAFRQALAQGCRPEQIVPYLQEITFKQNRPNPQEYSKDEL